MSTVLYSFAKTYRSIEKEVPRHDLRDMLPHEIVEKYLAGTKSRGLIRYDWPSMFEVRLIFESAGDALCFVMKNSEVVNDF